MVIGQRSNWRRRVLKRHPNLHALVEREPLIFSSKKLEKLSRLFTGADGASRLGFGDGC
jgi:hypothetical protein